MDTYRFRGCNLGRLNELKEFVNSLGLENKFDFAKELPGWFKGNYIGWRGDAPNYTSSQGICTIAYSENPGELILQTVDGINKIDKRIEPILRRIAGLVRVNEVEGPEGIIKIIID